MISRPTDLILRSPIQSCMSTQLCVTWVLFFHYYLAISTTNWVQVCYFMHMLRYTKWELEKTGLWQLPMVSTVFKRLHEIGHRWACDLQLLLNWYISIQFMFYEMKYSIHQTNLIYHHMSQLSVSKSFKKEHPLFVN